MKSLLWILCVIGLEAHAARFEVRDVASRDVVQFVSEAPLEKVVGLSNALLGWIEVDPNAPMGLKGEFEVDVRSIETGNSLRNDNLRDRFLNAGEFATAKLVFDKVVSTAKPKLSIGEPNLFRVNGRLTIRGVEVKVTPAIRFTYFKASDATKNRLPGNLLKGTTTFDIALSDFGIVIPAGFKLQLAKTVQVSVDFVGTDAPAPGLNVKALPEAPKAK